MSYMVWLVLAVLGLFAAAAWLAAWSRHDTWGRAAAVVLFLGGIPIVVWFGIESLGRHKPLYVYVEVPKPVWYSGILKLAWGYQVPTQLVWIKQRLDLTWDLKPGDHRVLAVKMVQDKAIYLYLDDPARIEPRPVVLPWDNEAANRIQKLQDEAGPDDHGQFMMRYEPSLDVHGPQFHPLPQPPVLPPKPRQDPGVRFEQGV